MKVSLRVLAALNERRPADQADVEALRQYLGHEGPADLDELACDVIQKALQSRAQVRAVKGA